MRKQNIFGMSRYVMIFSLMLLLLVAVAMAAPALTINTATWGTNTVVNISTKSANDASLVNMSHITVRFSAADTANSSVSMIINITNTTATNFDFGYANFTFGNSIVLEDTAIGSATAISTGVGASDAVTSSATTITVGRTTPTAPSAQTPSGTVHDRDQTFTATVVGAETTGCRLNFVTTNPGSSSYAMTHSGTSCTLALTGIPSTTYNYYISATDGVDTTNGANVELTVNGGQMTSAKKAAVVAAKTGQPVTKEGAQKGLAIINNGKAGSGNGLSDEFTKPELTKTGAGAVGGAVIGTFIVPGLGTGVGALIGAGVGAWF